MLKDGARMNDDGICGGGCWIVVLIVILDILGYRRQWRFGERACLLVDAPDEAGDEDDARGDGDGYVPADVHQPSKLCARIYHIGTCGHPWCD